MTTLDAVVVGSGPNGLAGALTLAQAGLRVAVYEASSTPGGGCRTQELTLPGFAHDVCSAVHPMLAASPFFREHRPESVRLLTPPVAYAHPLDGGRAAAVRGTVGETAASLGADERVYRALLGPIVKRADAIVADSLAPLTQWPRHPFAMASFGARSLWPATLVGRAFGTDEGKALFAGAAAHSLSPLSQPLTTAFGLILAMLGHSGGWPIVEGGSGRIAAGLVAALQDAGGQLHTDSPIGSLAELPPAPITLLDTSPEALITLAGDRLTRPQRRKLASYQHGPGVFKLDWALSAPVPWEAPACHQTATVHIGGTFDEVAHSEAEVGAGRHPDRPFVIASQPSLFDPGRAPEGQHTLWGYCHVPNGSTEDMTDRIETQIERFAPGFKRLILKRHAMACADFQTYNPNYVGGDINNGATTVRQTFLGPSSSLRPYRTPLPGVYLASACTPPGGGVHGMCGVNAARAALRDLRR